MKKLANIVLCVLASSFAISAFGAQPLIDNERVTVWDTTASLPAAQHDFISIPLSASEKGTAVMGHPGDMPVKAGARTIVIELKDHPVPPLANTSGYPDAYDRPHITKLFENDKVIVWSYHWKLGEPTPMHFHAKDVVVVYEEHTALRSTTPDGKSTLNEYKFADVRFNRRNRIHTETLVRDNGSAIIIELK